MTADTKKAFFSSIASAIFKYRKTPTTEDYIVTTQKADGPVGQVLARSVSECKNISMTILRDRLKMIYQAIESYIGQYE